MPRSAVSSRMAHSRETPLQCGEGEKTSTTSEELTQHGKTETGERIFKCNMCDKIFKYKSCLLVHMRCHSDERPHKCDVCDKAYKSPSVLKLHAMRHTGEEPYTCDKCEITFAKPDELREHKRKHTGEKPYQCRVCDKTFTRLTGMKKHRENHWVQRHYKCDTCDKSFVNKTRLRYHEEKHRARLFKCEQCGQSFAQYEWLFKHKMIHSVEKHYKCDECDEAYTGAHDLADHIQSTHSGEGPYRCEGCDKTFSTSLSWSRHKLMAIHKGDCGVVHRDHSYSKPGQMDPYRNIQFPEGDLQCDQCPTSFAEASHLRMHKMILHDNENVTLQMQISDHSTEKDHELALQAEENPGEVGLQAEENPGEVGLWDEGEPLDAKSYTDEKHLQAEENPGEVGLWDEGEPLEVKSYTDVKPLACDLCFKCFTSPISFSQHMKDHKGVKTGERCTNKEVSIMESSQECSGEKPLHYIKQEPISYVPYNQTTCQFSPQVKIEMELEENMNSKISVMDIPGEKSLVEKLFQHTGERPFSCVPYNQTSSQFSPQDSMKTEMDLGESANSKISVMDSPGEKSLVEKPFQHAGERPFSCVPYNQTIPQFTTPQNTIKTEMVSEQSCMNTSVSVVESVDQESLVEKPFHHREERPFSCVPYNQTIPQSITPQNTIKTQITSGQSCAHMEVSVMDSVKKLLREKLLQRTKERPISCVSNIQTISQTSFLDKREMDSEQYSTNTEVSAMELGQDSPGPRQWLVVGEQCTPIKQEVVDQS